MSKDIALACSTYPEHIISSKVILVEKYLCLSADHGSWSLNNTRVFGLINAIAKSAALFLIGRLIHNGCRQQFLFIEHY